MSASERAGNGVRPVVVVQSGDAFENRTRVLPLAIACRAQGWDPIVMVNDRGAAALFALSGVACVAVAEVEPARQPLEDLDLDPDDLCPLDLRIRALQGRALSADDWETVQRATATIWRMLDALSPQALFVWNGFTGLWANALRLYKQRRGLPGGFMERGPAPGDLFVDPDGVNGDASLSRETSILSSSPPAPRPNGASKSREKIVFVPLQVHTDSNILLHSPRISRMRDLVVFAVRVAEGLGEDWRVVARPHPEELPGARLNLPIDPRLTVDAETPLEEWLDRAAVCLTINSNVGLLAALRGLVVACLGEGLYCRQGFVIAGQRCEPEKLAAAALERLNKVADIAAAAEAFRGTLYGRSLFWADQPAEIAAAKLTPLGLTPCGAALDAADGSMPVIRPGAAYREMLTRLEALRGGTSEIVAGFDFVVGETQFLTYRRNRAPLSRERLSSDLARLFGRPVRLAAVHHALDGAGDVLLSHSKREASDRDAHALVLDEFALPHARTYLSTR